MQPQEPHEAIRRLKHYIDRVVLETARSGQDVGTLIADIEAMLKRAEQG